MGIKLWCASRRRLLVGLRFRRRLLIVHAARGRYGPNGVHWIGRPVLVCGGRFLLSVSVTSPLRPIFGRAA